MHAWAKKHPSEPSHQDIDLLCMRKHAGWQPSERRERERERERERLYGAQKQLIWIYQDQLFICQFEQVATSQLKCPSPVTRMQQIYEIPVHTSHMWLEASIVHATRLRWGLDACTNSYCLKHQISQLCPKTLWPSWPKSTRPQPSSHHARFIAPQWLHVLGRRQWSSMPHQLAPWTLVWPCHWSQHSSWLLWYPWWLQNRETPSVARNDGISWSKTAYIPGRQETKTQRDRQKDMDHILCGQSW